LVACRWLTEQQMSESLKAAEACLRHLEQIEAQLHSRESAAALAEARGLVALRNHHAATAVEQSRQAAAGWLALERPYDQARALNDLGQALSETGDSGQAQAVFKQACDLIAALAEQLEDSTTKSAFLNSELARQLYQVGADLGISPQYAARPNHTD
jgi:tetratricopeptide (TPR) repeat protein